MSQRDDLLDAVRAHWKAKYAGRDFLGTPIAPEDRALYDVSKRIRAERDAEPAYAPERRARAIREEVEKSMGGKLRPADAIAVEEVLTDVIREAEDKGLVPRADPPPPRGPVLIVEWRDRRVTFIVTLEGEDAKAALDMAGNDLPEVAKDLLLAHVRP